jgi:hypothetical protein
MPDDVLPPAVDPAPPTPPPSPPEPRVGRVECEFCGCSLDTRGNIIKRGDGARRYLAQEDEIARLKSELDTAQTRNTELAAQVAELQPKRRNILY